MKIASQSNSETDGMALGEFFKRGSPRCKNHLVLQGCTCELKREQGFRLPS